jgi:hypothetical protein
MVAIKAGTFDQRLETPQPTIEIFCRNAWPWIAPTEGVVRLDAGS